MDQTVQTLQNQSLAKVKIIDFKRMCQIMSYLNVEEAAKILSCNKSTIRSYIKKNKLPNAFQKENSRSYLIPESDIDTLKDELTTTPEGYLTIPEVASRLSCSDSNIRIYIKQGKFPNTIEKKHGRGRLIPKSDVEDFEQALKPDGYVSLEHAANMVSLNTNTILRYINDNKLSNHKVGRKYWILEKDILNLQQDLSIPKGYITTKEAAKRMLWSESHILTYIRTNKLPNSVLRGAGLGYLIPELDIDNLKRNLALPEGYIPLKEAAKILGISIATLRDYIKVNKFPNTIFRNQTEGYLILESDISAYEKSLVIPDGFLTVSQAAQKLSCHEESVREHIRKGNFPNYIRGHKNEYLILETDIQLLEMQRPNKLPGHITIKEAAERLACHPDTIRKYIKVNKFPNAILRARREGYFIPETDIESFELALSIPPGYLTISEVAERLKFSEGYTKQLILNNRFPRAYKMATGSWVIPEADIANYETSLYQQFTPETKGQFTTLDAINKFKYKSLNLEIPNTLQNSFDLYMEFVNHTLSNSKANGDTLNKKVVYYANTIDAIISIIPREVYLLTDREIEGILQSKSTPDYVKQYFVSFLQYCAKRVNCNFKNNYNMANKDPKDKSIYSFEKFMDYYNYVKNIEVHVSEAIKTKTIAQTWLFVLMHMINAWRKSDIIHGLPSIDLDDIKVNSLSYFEKERLSQEQAQLIVNQVYLKVGKLQISKTGALGQFLCHNDLVVPFATAVVIVELHRRKWKDILLLESIRHNFINKKFFKHKKDLSDFKSLKMNRTLLTYYFHHINESGKDADISYELTRTMRYHKDQDSTTVYIQFTNEDGPLDKVSLNLFNRGHFGWLYKSMINLYTEQSPQTLEERTKMIQLYRDSYAPIQLEGLSSFLLKEQNNENSLPLRLAMMSKKELEIKLKKIFHGEMPAKMKHAQCFIFPKCSNKTATSCLNCEYIIPKDYLLFSIGEELKRLIESIKSTKFEAIRKRDSSLLFKVLFILDQAAVELGKEYIGTFIDLRDLKSSLIDIQDNLSVTSKVSETKV